MGLRIGSQLMTNSPTTRAFPTDRPTNLAIACPSVRVQRPWRDKWAIRTTPPPVPYQALCMVVQSPHSSRRDLLVRIARRGLEREKRPKKPMPSSCSAIIIVQSEWFKYWQKERLDLVLTVPNAFACNSTRRQPTLRGRPADIHSCSTSSVFMPPNWPSTISHPFFLFLAITL